MRRPRVNAEAPLAADVRDEILIKNLEQEAEPLFQFFLPLKQHGGRTSNHYLPDLLAHQQLPRDESGFNGLAEANVVSNEKIHPRKSKSFSERFELISIETDACPEG